METPVATKEDVKEQTEKVLQEYDSKLAQTVKDAMAEASKDLASSAKSETSETGNVSQEQGISGALRGITDIEIAGIPIGKAAVGTAVATVSSEIIDLITEKVGLKEKVGAEYGGAIVDGIAAYVTKRWGSRYIGGTAADVAVLLLAYDALRRIVPISDWVKRLIPGSSSGEFGEVSAGETGTEETGGESTETPAEKARRLLAY